ncbi:hypothetical protein SAMN02745126_01119 [Enhydrobacter aerosaccus]|uniref:Peptidase propeptide and YPEB domain-containing protein n=2 Tax=Enhydrobacter aerosaccus TaxID=225324 RepID=A0A1T4KS53_9HYPH|nr:hypothetical protein SAMN02745126_01119 [Enhydrobacter aerosaccus]
MGGADTAVKGGAGESANGVTAGSKSGLETPAVTGESPSVANASGQQLSSAALTARKAIERDGYKDVQGLAKGSDGLWHAQALRGNTQVQVTVDRAGMVSAQ